MGRAFLISFALLCTSAVTAGAQQSPTLVPSGGKWQSLPYTQDERERANRVAPAMLDIIERQLQRALARLSPGARPQRRPVAAADTAREQPQMGAAAKAREFARRIESLAPGIKLDRPIIDPDNPLWRRRRPGRPGPDGRDFSVPFDESDRVGFIARGFREDPAWNHPNGALGATFGLRARF